jgi:hypothetical protein
MKKLLLGFMLVSTTLSFSVFANTVDINQIESYDVIYNGFGDSMNSNNLMNYEGSDNDVLGAKALVASASRSGITVKKVYIQYADNSARAGLFLITLFTDNIGNAVSASYHAIKGNSGGYSRQGMLTLVDVNGIERKCEVYGGRIITTDKNPSLIKEISLANDVNWAGDSGPYVNLECNKLIESLNTENLEII